MIAISPLSETSGNKRVYGNTTHLSNHSLKSSIAEVVAAT